MAGGLDLLQGLRHERALSDAAGPGDDEDRNGGVKPLADRSELPRPPVERLALRAPLLDVRPRRDRPAGDDPCELDRPAFVHRGEDVGEGERPARELPRVRERDLPRRPPLVLHRRSAPADLPHEGLRGGEPFVADQVHLSLPRLPVDVRGGLRHTTLLLEGLHGTGHVVHPDPEGPRDPLLRERERGVHHVPVRGALPEMQEEAFVHGDGVPIHGLPRADHSRDSNLVLRLRRYRGPPAI